MTRPSLVLAGSGIVLLVVGACTGGKIANVDGGVADASTCTVGTVRFTFVSTSLATYCVGAPNACSNAWLSIRNAAGEERAVDPPCLSDCASCSPVACPASCAAPTRMPPGGEQRTWDGVAYAVRTCGAGTACADRACMPPGRYVAKMCAYRDLSADAPPSVCAPEASPTCAEVPFDWPPAAGSAEVVGVIDGTGGQRCCPTNWQLYACTYPDGGAGFSCHNPAQGCPSSTTCGAGCDITVAGRCGE